MPEKMSVTYAAGNIRVYLNIVGGYNDDRIAAATEELAKDGGFIAVVRVIEPYRTEIVTRNDDGSYEVTYDGE